MGAVCPWLVQSKFSLYYSHLGTVNIHALLAPWRIPLSNFASHAKKPSCRDDTHFRRGGPTTNADRAARGTRSLRHGGARRPGDHPPSPQQELQKHVGQRWTCSQRASPTARIATTNLEELDQKGPSLVTGASPGGQRTQCCNHAILLCAPFAQTRSNVGEQANNATTWCRSLYERTQVLKATAKRTVMVAPGLDIRHQTSISSKSPSPRGPSALFGFLHTIICVIFHLFLSIFFVILQDKCPLTNQGRP